MTPLERIEIAGMRIAYRRAGQGPPLLLLHGGLSDSREWRRQLGGLCDDFTVVAWDAPGCGSSSDPPTAYRMPDYADCLAAFVEGLDLRRPHVVGISFGGTLALELYRRRPDVPRTLVLASAYAGWAGSLPADAVAERLAAVLRDAELPAQEIARRWIPDLFTDAVSAEKIDEVVAVISDVHRRSIPTMARAMAEADLRDVLPLIGVPTLVLHGDGDVRAPLALAEELAATIPGARLAVLPAAGHQCNVEQPERFNDEVRRFVLSAGAR